VGTISRWSFGGEMGKKSIWLNEEPMKENDANAQPTPIVMLSQAYEYV